MSNKSLKRQKESLFESHNQTCITLPANISSIMYRDPKLVGFIAARHKFVSKILSNKRILEIGCQEGFGTLFVAPYVKSIKCIDFYPPFVEGFKTHTLPHVKNCTVEQGDITKQSYPEDFEGAYALDVLEHIEKEEEDLFWRNLTSSLDSNATAIIGMPSLESQQYASKASKIGHVNCKTGDELRIAAESHFTHVMILSMNDEMLHNGYLPMSQYIFAVCSGKKSK